MKKILVITSVIASMAATSAFAKTEGSYAGIDLLNTKVKYHQRYTNASTPSALNVKPADSDSAIGLGVNYKYAFNMNGIFFAPGVIAEHNDATVDSGIRRVTVENRLGVKADLGYDVTDTLGVYATVGYVGVNYKTRDGSTASNTGIKDGMAMDWMYGFGVKHDCAQNVALSLEYNTQSLNLKTDTNVAALDEKFRTKIDVIKVGLAYRF